MRCKVVVVDCCFPTYLDDVGAAYEFVELFPQTGAVVLGEDVEDNRTTAEDVFS